LCAILCPEFDAFTQDLKELFDLRIRFNYTLDHELDMSKSFRDVFQDMKKDALSQIQWLLDYFDNIDLFVSGFLLIVVIKLEKSSFSLF